MTCELYACLYAREFPAQALLRPRPELREQPCVVMEGDAPLELVCSLNTKARLLGMSRGMTRVEVDTFPASVALARSQKEEEATRAILLECAGAFSPRVEERSEGAAFVCGIDIAGTRSLFGPPDTLARRLVAHVRAVLRFHPARDPERALQRQHVIEAQDARVAHVRAKKRHEGRIRALAQHERGERRQPPVLSERVERIGRRAQRR